MLSAGEKPHNDFFLFVCLYSRRLGAVKSRSVSFSQRADHRRCPLHTSTPTQTLWVDKTTELMSASFEHWTDKMKRLTQSGKRVDLIKVNQTLKCFWKLTDTLGNNISSNKTVSKIQLSVLRSTLMRLHSNILFECFPIGISPVSMWLPLKYLIIPP